MKLTSQKTDSTTGQKMVHGGDLLTYAALSEVPLIDFSSNINPLGTPSGFREAVAEGADAVSRYPDIRYRELKKAIAAYLEVSPAEVLPGSGTMEIIHNIHYLFGRTVVFVPSFSEYTESCSILKQPVLELPLDSKFHIDTRLLKKKLKKNDLLFLGNPNNPTGLRIPIDTLCAVEEIVREKQAMLVLDEVFFEFCNPDYDTLKLFPRMDHLLILRAATKFFALPGIRLGYAVTSAKRVEELATKAVPWSINCFAEAAGRLLLRDKEYISRSQNYMATERSFLYRELSQFDALNVFPTDTNFILFRLAKGDPEDFFRALLHKGILLRKAESFSGLTNRHFRTAIKDRISNNKLIGELKEYFF